MASRLGELVPDALRRRLIAKFVLTLVLLALVIGTVGLVATDELHKQTKDDVEREFRGLAGSKATLIGEWMRQTRLTTKLVSENDAWAESPDEMKTTLETERSSLTADVRALHVINVSGDQASMVATTAADPRTPAPLERWLKGQTFDQVSAVAVSQPYPAGDENVVAFASPVGAGRNRVLVVETDLASLSSLLATSGTTRSKVQVVNEANTIVAAQSGANASAAVVGAKYATGSALDPVKQARKLRDTDTRTGVIERMPGTSKVIEEPYTAGYAPIEGTDWVVVVHAPRSQLFGFVQTISNLGLFATVGLVLLVGLVGVGLGYSVTQSINRLADKAEEMEHGDLGVDLSTDRIDEIGKLYASFASMRDEVRQRILDEEEARAETQEVKSNVRQVANHLERKADEYSTVMQRCADGDLTQRLDTQSRSEAMSNIGTEFNEMVAELEAAIDQLTDFADEVVGRSEVVMQGAESVNDASQQVAQSIQQISDEADEQRTRVETVADDLHAVAQSLEDLPADQLDDDLREQIGVIEELSAEIDEIAAFSEETMAEAQNVAAAAEEQTSALTEVTQSARDLHDHADPLGAELGQFRTDADAEFQFGQVTPPDEE